jgi:hypothetical protein
MDHNKKRYESPKVVEVGTFEEMTKQNDPLGVVDVPQGTPGNVPGGVLGPS